MLLSEQSLGLKTFSSRSFEVELPHSKLAFTNSCVLCRGFEVKLKKFYCIPKIPKTSKRRQILRLKAFKKFD